MYNPSAAEDDGEDDEVDGNSGEGSDEVGRGMVQTIHGWVPRYTGPKRAMPADERDLLPAPCCGCGMVIQRDYGDDIMPCDVCEKIACGGCAVRGYPDCGHC
mmetsp:Transcript_55394/g.95488  ORF Transcript_55394/g.95488 Transcript_55394/m.95488 type:complete len:102 (+) Transcript_55394:487-792(+)